MSRDPRCRFGYRGPQPGRSQVQGPSFRAERIGCARPAGGTSPWQSGPLL